MCLILTEILLAIGCQDSSSEVFLWNIYLDFGKYKSQIASTCFFITFFCLYECISLQTLCGKLGHLSEYRMTSISNDAEKWKYIATTSVTFPN